MPALQQNFYKKHLEIMIVIISHLFWGVNPEKKKVFLFKTKGSLVGSRYLHNRWNFGSISPQNMEQLPGGQIKNNQKHVENLTLVTVPYIFALGNYFKVEL